MVIAPLAVVPIRRVGGLRPMNDHVLSSPARMARMSLNQDPNRNTPEAMASGPLDYSIQEGDFLRGLRELEESGLAVCEDGAWRLTSAGHYFRR